MQTYATRILSWFCVRPTQNYQEPLQGLPSRDASVDESLLDVEHVRMNAFKNARPSPGWMHIIIVGILRSVFLPFAWNPWGTYLGLKLYLFLVIMWFIIFSNCYLVNYLPAFSNLKSEVQVPMWYLILLSVFFSHLTSAISPDFPLKTLKSKSRRKKKSRHRRYCNSTADEHPTASDASNCNRFQEESLINTPIIVEQTVFSREEFVTSSPKLQSSEYLNESTAKLNNSENDMENNEKRTDLSKINLMCSRGQLRRRRHKLRLTISEGDQTSDQDDVRQLQSKSLESSNIKRSSHKRFHNYRSAANNDEVSDDDQDDDFLETSNTSFVDDGLFFKFSKRIGKISNLLRSFLRTPHMLSYNSSHLKRDNSSDTNTGMSSDVDTPEVSQQINTGTAQTQNTISVMFWDATRCRKAEMTAERLVKTLISRQEHVEHPVFYAYVGLSSAVAISVLPIVFHVVFICYQKCPEEFESFDEAWSFFANLTADLSTFNVWIYVSTSIVCFLLILPMFVCLCVSELVYMRRYQLSKALHRLTSARKARKCQLPHFRLTKVRNIRMWLMVRSLLMHEGPQQPIEVIVSDCFLIAIASISSFCMLRLQANDEMVTCLFSWLALLWSLCSGVFVLRFITLGREINKNYSSTSNLITERINLALRIERKPDKKEEYLLADHVLELAVKLIKEIERPYKISGLVMNSTLYNAARVVILSAYSGVMSEMLGFKLKLWKM